MKCIKCKAELKQDAKFCTKCGTSVEESRAQYEKYRKMGVIVLAAAVLLVAFIVGIVSGVRSAKNNNLNQTLAAANVASGGELATAGDKVYIVVEDDVYVTNHSYKNRNRLFSAMGELRCIAADDRAVYYIESEFVSGSGTSWRLMAYELAGKKKTQLANLEKKATQLSVWKDHLYFLQDEKLKAMKLPSGEVFTVAEEGINAYTCADNGIYYVQNNTVYKMASPGASAVEVTGLPWIMLGLEEADQMYLWGNKLYVRFSYKNDGTVLSGTCIALDLKSKEGNYVEMSDALAHFPVDGDMYYLLRVDPTNQSECDAFVDYFYDMRAEAYINDFPSLNYSKYDSNVRNYVEATLTMASYSNGRVGYSRDGDSTVNILKTSGRYYSNIYRTRDGLMFWSGMTDSWDFYEP